MLEDEVKGGKHKGIHLNSVLLLRWGGTISLSPLVPPHQVVDDNFITKFAGRPGFVIPAQSSEDVDLPPLKQLILILVQLFKCAQNVRFADFRKIIVLQ